MKVVKVIMVLAGLLLALAVAAYVFWLRPQLRFAEVGTAYGSKQMCSCLFVSDMSLDQCQADLGDDLAAVTFIREEAAVTAQVLDGRISNRAEHVPGLGCKLVPDS